MKWNVYVDAEVHDELDAIFDFILQESEDASLALKVIENIDATIRGLQYMPLRHRLYPTKRLEERCVRYAVSGAYVIFFIADEQMYDVHVRHVLHAYQMPTIV